MINDLDETLSKLLKSKLPSRLAEQVQVSFSAPDDQFPPPSVTLPAIDLFLYDIRENVELRSNEIYFDRKPDGTVVQNQAPVRVDISYLITAWPSQSVADPSEDEHRLLGEVIRALIRYRTIPNEMLQGELASQNLPLPVTTLQPGRLQSLGEFWQALGGKPKAALNYMVTLAMDASAEKPVDLVTEKVLKFRMQMGSGAAAPESIGSTGTGEAEA
jgi:hypothetical protein